MALNIPENYEAYKMNCTAGHESVGILCRRPDGGVSDLHKRMNRKAVDGICPACGRDMDIVGVGIFACNSGHILVVMTNDDASKAHFGTYKGDLDSYRGVAITGKLPRRRATVRKAKPVRKKNAVIPPIATHTHDEAQEVDVNELMAQAMKEADL